MRDLILGSGPARPPTPQRAQDNRNFAPIASTRSKRRRKDQILPHFRPRGQPTQPDACRIPGPSSGWPPPQPSPLVRRTRQTDGNSANGPIQADNSDVSAATKCDDELDQRILAMEKAVSTAFYRNILREYGRVNQPKLIRDKAIKQKVLQILESAALGIDRLEAIMKRLDPETVQVLLAKLQAPPLGGATTPLRDIVCIADSP